MEDFKQKEIYDRIWREEAEGNVFHGYFTSVDNLHSSQMLYLSSMGMEAVKRGLEHDDLTKPSSEAVAEAVGLGGDSEEQSMKLLMADFRTKAWSCSQGLARSIFDNYRA